LSTNEEEDKEEPVAREAREAKEAREAREAKEAKPKDIGTPELSADQPMPGYRSFRTVCIAQL